MSQKHIYGALEILEEELRFVLGEFHNGQLNILKTMAQATDALSGVNIIDQRKLVSHIKQLINRVENQMNFAIKKVILIIPSDQVYRESKRLNVLDSDEKLYVDPTMMGETLDELSRIPFNEKRVVVNKVVNRFIIDGISSKRLSDDKNMQRLAAEIDIYSGKTDLVFDYIKCVESAGFEILDIYFDSYCIAKEAAILDISNIKNMILFRYEQANTTLTLFKDGKILSSVMEPIGYQSLVDELVVATGISEENARRIILTNNYIDINKDYTSPIYVWEYEGEAIALNESDLNDIVGPILDEQFNIIKDIAAPILELDNTEIYIVGKGSSILSVDEKSQDIFGIPAKVYIPETLGARQGALTACLGALYAYHDQTYLWPSNDNSIDKVEFKKSIEYKSKVKKSHDESMTHRFKELLGMSKE